MSFDLVGPENQDIMENLKVGQIFSAYNLPVSYSYKVGSEIRSSQPEYMVYLGPDLSPNGPWNHILFLVVLKNGDTIILSETRGNFERKLDNGWVSKSNKNRKLIPNQLLQEIRLQSEKNNVEIVGDETPIQLPNNIKNQLLVLLGQPDDKEFFPLQEQQAGKSTFGKSRAKYSTFGKSRAKYSTFGKSRTKTTFKKSTFKKSRAKKIRKSRKSRKHKR